MDDAPGEIVSELIDLTAVDLAKLPSLDNCVLADSVQRILDEVASPEEAVAGFQSSL